MRRRANLPAGALHSSRQADITRLRLRVAMNQSGTGCCPSPRAAVTAGLGQPVLRSRRSGQQVPQMENTSCTEAPQQQAPAQAPLIASFSSPWFPGQSGALPDQSHSPSPDLLTAGLVSPSLLPSFFPSSLFLFLCLVLFVVAVILIQALIYPRLAPSYLCSPGWP